MSEAGSSADTLRLVLAPGCPFAALAAAVEAAKLERLPSPTASEPLVAGEPELATWYAPQGDATVVYTCNPAIWLRVLAISGEDRWGIASALRDALPAQTPEDFIPGLESADPREQLRAVHAAAEIGAIELIGALQALRNGPDRAVTAAAARAVDGLTLGMLEIGYQRLASEQRRKPLHAALYPRLGDAEMRKAALLAMLHSGAPIGAESCAVLRAALVDSDWRNRVTAMLVAARLGAHAVGGEVRAARLPEAGMDRRHRSLLAAMRKTVLAELAGMPVPAGGDAALQQALHRTVMGRPPGHAEPLLAWLAGFASAAP